MNSPLKPPYFQVPCLITTGSEGEFIDFNICMDLRRFSSWSLTRENFALNGRMNTRHILKHGWKPVSLDLCTLTTMTMNNANQTKSWALGEKNDQYMLFFSVPTICIFQDGSPFLSPWESCLPVWKTWLDRFSDTPKHQIVGVICVK